MTRTEIARSPSGSPTVEEILDMIWEALDDSMGPDWNTRLGARAVLQRLTDERLVIMPVPRKFEPTQKQPGDFVLTGNGVVRHP